MGKKTLAEVVIPTAPVHISTEDYIEVTGVGLAAITRLFNRHTAAMGEVFETVMKLKDNGGMLDNEITGDFMVQIISQFPDLVAELIVIASGEESDAARDMAARLPAVTQANALVQIFNLSIQSETELKKLMGVATNALKFATTLMARLKNAQASQTSSPLPAGFGDFERE